MQPLRFPAPRRARHRAQAGYSLIEFSVVAAPLLMVGLGSVEVAQWFFTKQAISLALLEAGRAGITQHAHPRAIEMAFEQALLPLYPASKGLSSAQRLRQALDRRSQAIKNPPWRIEVLNPHAATFLDFANPHLAISAHHQLAAIDNNYQAEQHQRNIERGWSQGRGPASGLSVYEANTLVLRLTYLHEPALPGIKNLIRQLAPTSSGYGAQAMARAGYLPMQQELRLTMQSHALQWPASASSKVTGPVRATSDDMPAADPCTGIWCLPNDTPPQTAPPSTPVSGDAGVPDAGDSWLSPGAPQPPQNAPPAGATTPPADDPACGITLCCLPGG
ncbi:MAG: pilus assembly protein [Burkholderiaceae bacterium]|nr:MAG: pilus assembly protein [Burkholderiaceae bacterium]TAM10865.1 MAG: pilus assembly protein [Pusillimonas sp.]